jgi:alkyl hydroperoxide reductase subunit AhpC
MIMAGLRRSRQLSLFALLLVLSFPVILPATENAGVGKLLAPGQAAPVSSLTAIDDAEHEFPVAGVWNLVFFWSLFCHSCIEEMPTVQARLADLGETGPEVFFVSLDTARMQKALINFCRLRDLKHTVLMERVASDSYEVADKWGVVMTPSVFIVNPAGEVAWASQGPLDIDRFFASFAEMAKPTASAASSCEGH